ncbi:MAG: 30S ribosomal protein S17 [Candidatus Terrybacteria bacterium RIFCSPLOWO2_01_FULL_44_24]|uniref:Small ribosomal subunit protein uS17 n=1 Tax=Candidatus Terrybacteria bacterium RIFCSPHIGHO2_01_FULL_43_35 TaxID=1802361 RepID=A0A1G2PD46_9BACT|nr:MAG: 30S ribosomal protein S17 [Candidatus Terrybacteria bacterium RIFCSPHIGHO2_01_FULL_43_35]OHA49425.1 MAG: 30S ribosomal protein S17 [Candidatus Terrybacteria bacterium RIFCSPHIGHO2_02_FULL_43_14]OHA51652.1 MAG: 30S ribosomal protein S17 [Candidatus Terrybacteria bacterium RIFCSPLOWO2_01_FULL_44_24]
MDNKTNKRKFVGTVVSDKMDKTVVVEMSHTKMHPRVRRYIRRTKRFLAHNPDNTARVGDVVVITETRPLSKLKRWQVVEVKAKANVLSDESVA